MAQNDYDGLEHGTVRWLTPRHDHKQEQFGMQQARRHRINSPMAAELNSHFMSRTNEGPQRPKNQTTWASGGPGMQAVFLGSKQRSCGTGVFLPRTHSQFRNKPAFSPVLLPARVVQALNLNVHELNQQIYKPKPADQTKNTAKRNDENLEKNRDDIIYLSPDIYLPKEWTY